MHHEVCACTISSVSHGKKLRWSRLPAWGMPYTGLTTSQTVGLPSAPIFSKPGGMWQ